MGKSALDSVKTVVLVGKTGNGKSATGNSIIGADVFDSMHSFSGVTATTQMHTSILPDGQILNVIDTPGLFDSSIEPKSIGKEIAKCIHMAKNGIHAVLVVVSLRSRFSLEEVSAIENLSQFFGGKIGDYMILVFTHGDVLQKTPLDKFLERNSSEPLEKIIELCGGRYVMFDNETEDEGKKFLQLEELLRHVDTVVENNDNVPYTNELFVDSLDVSANGSNKAFEEHILEKIESKLREQSLMLEKQLADEKIARMEAEAKEREARMQLSSELNRMMLDLERSRKDKDELQKMHAETEAKLKETEAKCKENENELKETKRKLDMKWGCVIS